MVCPCAGPAISVCRISPTAGYHSQPPEIEFSQPSTQSSATIHYTLDGNDPTTSSAAYSAPFALPSSATVKARAFKTGWTASGVATAVYEVRTDLSAPTLTARVRPGVNAQGWTMGPATVTFICHDAEGPVQDCPAPIFVPEETDNYPYSRTISDAAGRSTTVSGVVRVDTTPPQLALTAPTAPADGLEVSTSFVTVTGTASDAMSGLADVRCNDVVATVSNGNVTCDVPLRAGRNPVVLQASDVAGHSTSIGIVVWRTVAVDRLTLSPEQLTLQEGDEAPLRLVNNMGRAHTGATWTVSEPFVVEVVDAPEPLLRALAPGVATVTATLGSLTAQSTVTVVGATIVLVPGTTRWAVQGTPGLELQKVIYTHQTSPDVPEAALLEASEGANVQLRGINNGATTSITPVSGELPGQTMGDSFGGVLLVQTSGDRTSLQRVGFTPDVQPWRWVSSGGLANVVQTNDGTIFASERVLSGGELTAASVVVLDGATGQLRARVPITTATHDESIAIDCHPANNAVSDNIGVTSLWALSTSDTYAVVIAEGDSYSTWIGSSPDAYCGPGAHGTSSGTTFLLTVDTSGGSTITQLAQGSETWPSNQGNLSTPGVNGLAADARGNFVVAFSNNERQLFGPEPGAPVQPLGSTGLVSYDGLRIEREDNLLVVRSFDNQPLWADPTPGIPVAFQPERNNFVVREESLLREVGPNASVATTPLPPGTTSLAAYYRDIWRAQVDNAFVEFTGPVATEPLMAGEDGSERSQGTPLSPICNGDVQDERTKLVGEYATYRVGWQPACEDFVQNLPAASDWTLGDPRQANTWNVSNSYHWALLSPILLTNAKCIMASYGSVPTLNSGYRSPSSPW